jgi:adenine phosphoribosyltransferase
MAASSSRSLQMASLSDDIQASIRDIPDFPKPGILFKDITPVLADPGLMKRIIDHLTERYAGQSIDAVVGMESRGFIFGTPLAIALGAAFVPARKPGKLPYDTVSFSYQLEYGSNTLEMHTDAVKHGDRVLVVDDLLATGGTANATIKLIESLGATVVEAAFVIELGFLKGTEAVTSSTYSLISY